MATDEPTAQATTHCSRCALPAAFPRSDLDQAGVCRVCRSHSSIHSRMQEQKQTYRSQFEELLKTLHPRSEYAVLMAYSGGKDSSYVLKRLVEDFQVRALAVTFDNGFLSPQARDNIYRVTKALDVDHLLVSPSRGALYKAFRSSAKSDIHPLCALSRASAICNTCMLLVKSAALRCAVEMEIPFICYGWSPTQVPHRSALLAMSAAMIRKTQADAGRLLQQIMGEEARAFTLQERHYRALEQGIAGHSRPSIHYLYPLSFWEYDERKIRQQLAELNWTQPRDTDPSSSNCLLNTFGIKIHLERFGFHPYAYDTSALVREGYLSRAEGLKRLLTPLDDNVIRHVQLELGIATETGYRK